MIQQNNSQPYFMFIIFVTSEAQIISNARVSFQHDQKKIKNEKQIKSKISVKTDRDVCVLSNSQL